ncbi:MAG: hypothetical protein IPL83_18005 [Bdellovibrionales bacterium]|nr:hypothetical protein [Bdellovibrionales bacterium]
MDLQKLLHVALCGILKAGYQYSVLTALISLVGFPAIAMTPALKCVNLLNAGSGTTSSLVEKNFEYGGYKFSVREMSREAGIEFRPKTAFDSEYHRLMARDSALVAEIGSVWQKQRFAIHHIPLNIGEAKTRASFQKNYGLRVLDMPIKMSGGAEYRLPKELRPFVDTIQQIVEHFHRIAPPGFAQKAFAYITLDQGMVDPGATQRKGGAHVDGFQGARIHPKNELNYSYVVSNHTPTAFYDQPFHLEHLEERVHDHFLEMDLQKTDAARFLTEEYKIYLMNAYTVHEATQAQSPGFRTFLRISFDVKEFDRLGNTHNPLFDYNWKMAPRETQSGLIKYSPLSKELQEAITDAQKGNTKALVRQFEDLKSSNLETFFNLSYKIVKAKDRHLLSILLPHLIGLSDHDVRAVRQLFVVATERNADSSTQELFISSLKRLKGHIKYNLFVDILFEVQANAPSLISDQIFSELTKGIKDDRLKPE